MFHVLYQQQVPGKMICRRTFDGGGGLCHLRRWRRWRSTRSIGMKEKVRMEVRPQEAHSEEVLRVVATVRCPPQKNTVRRAAGDTER